MNRPMPSGVRAMADRVLGAAGSLALRVGMPGGVVVLAYHDVPDRDTFACQLDEVARFAQVVSISNLGAATDRPAVCFTFDDGRRSVYETAFPMLRERGWPATIYPVAGLVGTDEPLWWDEVARRLRAGARIRELPTDPAKAVCYMKGVPDTLRRRLIEALRQAVEVEVSTAQLTWGEIREMAEAGWEVGNHSWSHPCLDRCEQETIQEELGLAHERIADQVGQAPTTLAYPNGNVDGRVRRVVADLGYETALLFDHRVAGPDRQDPLQLSRVRADPGATRQRFRALLSGLHPRVHRLLGRS